MGILGKVTNALGLTRADKSGGKADRPSVATDAKSNEAAAPGDVYIPPSTVDDDHTGTPLSEEARAQIQASIEQDIASLKGDKSLFAVFTKAMNKIYGDKPYDSKIILPIGLSYFAVGVLLEVLPAAGVSKLKAALTGDTRYEFYAQHVRSLTRGVLSFMNVGYVVDDRSIDEIVKVVLANREQNRPIFISATHQSWLDIPALMATSHPSRAIVSKPLGWLNPAQWVVSLTRMGNVSRPGKKPAEYDAIKGFLENPEAYQAELAGYSAETIAACQKYRGQLIRAINDMTKIVEWRKEDGRAMNTFTSGTRSLIDGVGEPKKGDANRIIENNGITQVETIFGTNQVWFGPGAKPSRKSDVGMNRDVYVRVRMLDWQEIPEIKNPPAGLSGDALKAYQVEVVTNEIFRIQVEDHLSILQDLHDREAKGDAKATAELAEFYKGFEPGLVLLREGKQTEFKDWAEHNKVAERYVIALAGFVAKQKGDGEAWSQMTALYGAGKPAIDDFRHSNIFRWAKGQLINQATTIGNWLGGLVNRNWFSKIPAANIEIQAETDFPDTFEQAEAGYQAENAEVLAKGQALADSQWALQSSAFQEQRSVIAERNRAAIADYRGAARDLHEVYQASVKPDFAPVSATSDHLDRTLIASTHFREIDSDLRRWFYHTHLAYQYWKEQAAAGNTKKATRIQKHYYGLLTRGIRLRMNNEVNRMLGHELGSMYSLKQYALLGVQYPKIKALAQRMSQVELIGYILGRGRTLAQEREKLEASVAVITQTIAAEESRGKAKKIGYSKKEMEAKIAMIKALEAAYPGQDLRTVLTQISGSFFVDVENQELAAQLEADSDLQRARKGYVAEKKRWLSDSRAHYVATMPARTRLVTETLVAELKVNNVDHDLQVSRYSDLWAKLDAKALGSRAASLTHDFEKALAEYEEAYSKYQAYTQKIINHEGKEYERSKLEGATFLKLLNLHWAVQDAYRYAKRPEAEKLRVLSAMFPNQTEALANRSQGTMKAMKGILQALPFDLIIDLYMHIFVFKTDPRQIQSYMSRWGHGALARRAIKVFLYGGRELAGYVGQYTGSKAMEEGVSFLTEEQKHMGTNPHAVQFDNIHESFGDYELMVGLFAALGLGSPNIVFEKLNFGPDMPVLGWVLNEGDGIENMRGVKTGMPELQDRIDEAVDHGVSAAGFGWGSRPYTAAMSPLAGESEAAFYARREFVTKYNYGEMGKAARDAETPLVPTTHMLADGQVPDFPLSGNGDKRSLAMGSPDHVRASIGFGSPIAAEIFDDDDDTLEAFGHGVRQADIERQMARYQARGQTADPARARMSAQSIASAHALADATESGRYLNIAHRYGSVRPGSRVISRPVATVVHRR